MNGVMSTVLDALLCECGHTVGNHVPNGTIGTAWCACGCKLPRPRGRWSDLPDGVLVYGEDNPYSSKPTHALLPWPRGASGDRLRIHLGMTDAQYLVAFRRNNLCPRGPWYRDEAERNARKALRHNPSGRFILLGAKVRRAFEVPEMFKTFDVEVRGNALLGILPHSSGLSRTWNEPDATNKARAVVSLLVLGGGRGHLSSS